MGLEVRVAGVCADDFVDNVFVLVGRVVDVRVVVDFVDTVVLLEVFGDDFVDKVLVAGRAVDVGVDLDFVDDYPPQHLVAPSTSFLLHHHQQQQF